jgi:hypothetical protein
MFLEAGKRWVASHQGLQLPKGLVTLEYFETPESVPKPGLWVDIWGRTLCGRLSLWVTGECDVTVLDIATGRDLDFKHFDLTDDKQVESVFTQFIDALS